MAEHKLIEGYVSRREAAALLEISERTLERWHTERRGPPVTRVGKKPLYNLDDLSSWLRSCREEPRAA